MGSKMIYDDSRRSGALRMNMEMTGTRRMRIDITSDVICPFCLLGVKQLIIALDQYNTAHPTLPIRADIRLLPFQLNPALTETPMDRRTYLREKFGPRADAISQAMAQKMADMGYKHNLDGQISSSHTAHRLQMYTLQNFPHGQLALAMDVFESFHVRGIHPSDHFALADIAVRHGVFQDEDEALDWLEGDECDEDVKRSYSVARKLGIGGVPFLVFQEKYAGSGAMGIDGFTNLLEEVIRREGRGDESVIPSPTSTAASPDGQVLSKDEHLVKDSAAA